MSNVVDHEIRGFTFREKVRAAVDVWRSLGSSAVYRPKSAQSNAHPENYRPTDALQLAPIQAAVNFIAKATASSEIIIEKRDGNEWVPVENHLEKPFWAREDKRPNKIQNQYEFLYNFSMNLLAGGNAYIKILSFYAGYPDMILSVPYSQVNVQFWQDIDRVFAGDEQLMYLIGTKYYKPYTSVSDDGDILHAKLITFDNIFEGVSPLQINAPPLRTALAADSHSELMFTSGGLPPAILSDKSAGHKDKADIIKAHYESIRKDPSQRMLPLVLGGDWQWLNTFIPPEELQLIESRKLAFNYASACYNIPTPFLGGVDVTTWGQAIRELLRFTHNTTTAPFMEHVGTHLSELLPVNKRARLNPEHLLGAEPLEDVRVLEREVKSGWLLPSEARRRRGYKPIDDIDERFERMFTKEVQRLDDGGDSDSGNEPREKNYQENKA